MIRRTGIPIALLLTLGPVIATGMGPAGAAPGDAIYIQGENVNVRSAPDLNGEVLMQLDRGHRLIERDRRAGWVSVEIGRPGGEVGWIHGSLVATGAPPGASIAPGSGFNGFRAGVASLNDRVRGESGIQAFKTTENLGDGMVELEATEEWLGQSEKVRRRILDSLVELWDTADNTGNPILVRIVDPGGDLIMSGTRGYNGAVRMNGTAPDPSPASSRPPPDAFGESSN